MSLNELLNRQPWTDLDVKSVTADTVTCDTLTATTVNVTNPITGGNATKIQGVDVSAAAPTAGHIYKYDAGGAEWIPALANAAELVDEPINAATPSNSQVLLYTGVSGAGGEWAPGAVPGAPVGYVAHYRYLTNASATDMDTSQIVIETDAVPDKELLNANWTRLNTASIILDKAVSGGNGYFFVSAVIQATANDAALANQLIRVFHTSSTSNAWSEINLLGIGVAVETSFEATVVCDFSSVSSLYELRTSFPAAGGTTVNGVIFNYINISVYRVL